MRWSPVVWTLIYAAVIMGLSLGVAWGATHLRHGSSVVFVLVWLLLLVAVVASLITRSGERGVRS